MVWYGIVPVMVTTCTIGHRRTGTIQYMYQCWTIEQPHLVGWLRSFFTLPPTLPVLLQTCRATCEARAIVNAAIRHVPIDSSPPKRSLRPRHRPEPIPPYGYSKYSTTVPVLPSDNRLRCCSIQYTHTFAFVQKVLLQRHL